MDYWISFLIELSAGLIGVFAGAGLALWVHRKAQEHHAQAERDRLQEDLENSRRLVISSVVKNTSESKRLVRLLQGTEDPYLFQVTLENSVWEATRSQFVRLASVDERVLLTRFFDHVRRLDRLIEFHRKVRADLEVGEAAPDAGERKLLEDLNTRLQEVANDIRIDGLVLVTDFGDAMHKRLLGIRSTGE
jgi:hypothetical protein